MTLIKMTPRIEEAIRIQAEAIRNSTLNSTDPETIKINMLLKRMSQVMQQTGETAQESRINVIPIVKYLQRL